MVPDLPSDSSKSLKDVQQSMQNTAYWVSNSRYSNQPDDSATFIKDKPDISERELCKEIIGIYFSEMDSDSSLSSSCLENSLDGEDSTSSSSSGDSTCLPRTLETNLDDFSTAVYILTKALEAHTRKISSAKVTKTESSVKSRSDPHRAVMANSHRIDRLCCKDKSVPKLRPEDFTFPFVEDKPSPIVITRVRRSKSMSRASKEWPW